MAAENAPIEYTEQAVEMETPPELEQTALGTTPADSYLLPLLQAEARQRQRDTRNILLTQLGFTGALLWVARTAMVYDDEKMLYKVLVIALMCLLMAAMFAQLCYRSYRRKRALAAELAKPQALESIGALIEATRVENKQARILSRRALTDLLPQLKASDTGLLTDAQRNRLLHLLTISPNDKGYRDLTELFSRSAYRREVEVRVAILKAYEQIGGPKELAQVARLAKGQMTWQSAAKVPIEIRQAAQECLPALQARAGEQRASEQLLRPSSGSAVPADVLLRASEHRPDVAPEELLRAGERRIQINTSAGK